MKKKFTKITSCLLCLAMLLSMAGPALAAAKDDPYEGIVLAPDMEIIDDGALSLDAPDADDGALVAVDSLPAEDPTASLLADENPFVTTGQYEIYPTPHSVTYADDTVTLPDTMQVTYGEGIDSYTKDRAVEAFQQAGVTLSESATTAVKLQVRVKGASETVSTTTSGLFDKYSAYKLTIDANGVTVVGVDTDAAFYGLTTVKRILQQVTGKQVKHLTVEDYADVPFRGFIEGYYGNPWTVEDRAALMEFGGELKMNIYFYAPKDDPKHSSKWRELYTQEELNTKIKPLAEAGNKSKCYYGFALHPFWAEGIDYSNDTQYAADLAVLKAKFEQVMSVGVRQIAILGDDRGVPSVGVERSYVRLMTDLTNWVSSEEMQTKYPGLKTSIPFCPNDYMGNGSSAQIQTLSSQLPASVPIIMTGGTIWGQVSHSFLSTYKANTNGGGTFMWVNWPCSDKSKGSLTMGAHDIVLHNDLTQDDINTLKGIMLNPMQQSEPSKQAIFTNADYAWNVWNGDDHQERKDNSWNDSFKYVDHDSAIETDTSRALREMGKHMIHQNGSVGWHEDYPESFELSPKLAAFRQKLENGTLSVADITAMRGEFSTLHDAAVLYKAKTTGNTRILGVRKAGGGYENAQEQMAPWLDYWEEFSQANLDLLDALALTLSNTDGSKDNDIVSAYLSAQSQLTAAQSHKFWYMDHDEYAIAGGMFIVPFTNALMAKVSELARTIIDPSVLIETVITSRTDVSSTDLAKLRDGSDSTQITFKSPASLSEGDYIGVKYNRPIALNSVNFKLGGANADGGKNTFGACKLQYTEDGATWKDIPGDPTIVNNTMNSSWNGSCRVAEIGISGLSLNAQGVRVVSTEDVGDIWIVAREIYINGKSGETTEDPVVDGGKLTGSVIKSSTWSVYQSYDDSKAIDGDDATFAWYDTGASDDSLVGDFFGLDLGSVQTVGRVRFLMGSDKWTNYKLQYSQDNAAWTDAGSFNTAEADVDLGGISARYVRFVNTVQVHAWVKVCELAIYAPASARNDISKIAYQSDAVKKIVNPVGTLEDDLASLTADNVMLRPGEFVGISLPSIRAITDIVADFTPAPGLVLKVGMSEAEMEVVDLNARMAFTGNARYVRLENEGAQTISFVLNELSVQSEEPASGIHFLSTSYGGAGNDGDARYLGTTGNWFDGDMNTDATFCANQAANQEIVYDLGQLRSISDLKMYTRDSNHDYPRIGSLQVSVDQASWVDLIDFNSDAETENAQAAGWTASNTYPNMVYLQATPDAPVEARYLRLYYTGAAVKWTKLSEIVINDGEYVSAYSDPTVETDPIEVSAAFTPDKLLDGDLTTGFRPNMDGKTQGKLTYRLSDETSIGQINILQDIATPSNATVRVRTGANTWETLGTLTQGLNQLVVDEDIANVFEIELSWGNVTPTFYELIAVSRAAVAESGGQIPSDPESVPINSYSGDARVIDFDENWKFNLGDASGASAQVYNDSSWRTINLPHDFSIEQDYTSAGEAESGYLPGGTGWYRKSFTIDSAWRDKVVSIDFGGAYMETEVYLNGTKLGENKNGYNPFSFVLPANLLNYTGENVIAVKVVNTIPSSRWYSGSGIYRSVHLTVSAPVHVARYGTYVNPVKGGGTNWTVNIKTDVQNDTNASASVTVKQDVFALDSAFQKTGAAVASHTSAATSVSAGATAAVEQSFPVQNPALWNSWDRGTPNLYVLVTTVQKDGQTVDTYETEFGFRTIEFTTDVGFKLNGVNTKLKGVCQHHDQGALGAEAWYRAMERQVEILMDMGCNSIRVTHNPADDKLIEICNRKGILIIDEAFDCWTKSKNGNSNDFARFFYTPIASDNTVVGGTGRVWSQFVLETMVNRDKNAPCVIMYSLGNEILSGAGDNDNPSYIQIVKDLVSWKEAIDLARPVTMGDDSRWTAVSENDTTNTASNAKAFVNTYLSKHGVVGFNYCHTRGGRDVMGTAHNNGWAMYGSETASHVNSRGVYNIKGSEALNSDKLLTSYDKSRVGWGDTAAGAWWYTIRFDYNMGEYVWTGFDYIGEPTPNNGVGAGWVNGEDSPKSSFFGIIDTNGIPKDNYYLYRSMWMEDGSTTLHVLPTWDQEDLMLDSGKVEVVAYTNAPVVRVYLNGTEVGAAKANETTTAAGHKYRVYEATALQNGGTNTFVAGSTAHEGNFTGTALYSTFNVPYEAGTLEVKAFASESATTPITGTVGRSVVRTTSGASKLVASADRETITNDGRDLSYVTIDVVDAKGEIVNGATPEIKVSVTGDGVFMGLDNGVQPDHTSYTSDTRKAGAGRLVAIIQSTKKAGSFTVTATSAGLSPAVVTVTTGGAQAPSGSDTAPVSYDLSKTIYVQLNTEPDLPKTAVVTLGNGAKATKAIAWNSYDKGLLATPGAEFAITGVIADYNIAVSIGVVVLDDIAALLNYSAAVRVGEAPTLPAGRPAVMADGSVVSAQFPVTWEEPDAKVYNKAGKVIVNGTAQVFGKDYHVTATIRVAAPSYVEGSEATSGITVFENGENKGLLANYAPAYADHDASTSVPVQGALGYSYDTAQNVYKIALTYKGTPPSGGVTIALSDKGYIPTEDPDNTSAVWTPVRAAGVVSGNTVTYQLDRPFSTEAVKFTFASQVDLAEVLLTTGLAVFDVGSTAELDGMKLNGADVPAAQVAAKFIRTSSVNAVVTPVSNSNVAVTILPENANSQIVIVTESEDHASRAVYTVQLDSIDELPATDASNDYDRTKTTATAPSQAATSGSNSASAAVDNNTSTHWHTHWSNGDQNTLGSQPERRYIQLELQETTSLAALRYLPRQDGSVNGRITKYEVWVSTADSVTAESKDTFVKVSEGSWENSAAWKIAMFNTPSNAKFVRLYSVTAGSDSGGSFISASEIRLVKTPENSLIDLSEATLVVEPNVFEWKNRGIQPGTGTEGATVTVTLRGETLERGVDYELAYENNIDPGTAYIYAQAKDTTKYQGAAAGTFQIVKTDAKITSFQPFTVRVQPGVDPTPNLPTTVQAFTDSQDGQTMLVHVTWDEVPTSVYVFPTDPTKTYTLYGSIDDPDMMADGAKNVRPAVTLNIAWSQSVDTVSLVTAAGVLPTLPDTATVRFDDGTSGERTVVRWYLESNKDADPKPALTAADFATPGTVTLLGDVTGIDRVKAKATVRVAGSDSEMIWSYGDNIALNTNSSTNIFPFAMGFVSSGNNNPYQAIKGTTSGSTDIDKRWSDWERNTYHTSPRAWLGVAFETSTQNVTRQQSQTLTLVPKTVSKAQIMFVDENGTGGAVTFPESYVVQRYTGPVTDLTFDTRVSTDNQTPGTGEVAVGSGNGCVRSWTNSPLLNDANWTNVAVKGTQPAVPSANGNMLEVEFEPVSTAMIRVLVTPKSNKWVGIQALEVYEATSVPKPNADFTATVTLGGEAAAFHSETIDGKEVKVLERTLAQGADIPQLAVTATDNASISVIQAARVPGLPEVGASWAQAVVTSEDGSKTETYLVKFTREGVAAGYFIENKIPAASQDKITLSANGGAVNDEITISVKRGYAINDLWVQYLDGPRAGELVTVSASNTFLMPAANVSIRANAVPIPYTITYLLNGGSFVGTPRATYDVETATFSVNDPSRPGYTFMGWVGGGLTVPTKSLRVEQGSIGDRTYTAVWQASGSTGGGGGNNGGGSVIAPPVGDTTVTTTNRDGSTTVTTTTSDGLVSAVTTRTDGTQSAVIQIPQNSGSSVTASLPALEVNADKTPEVAVQNNTGRPMSVTIPVSGSNTIVAVRLEKDGSETVVPYSVVDEDGLRIKLNPGDETFRLVDNAKDFTDVPDSHWAAGAVDFASSRELFNGMGSADTFAPAAPMDRAMMTTVLWRLAEKPDASVVKLFDDVLSGSYYEQAVAWGVAAGVVKGTDNGFEPNTPVTRETLAVMLYRAAGSPVVVDEIPRRFTDGDKVAPWAQEAVIWCIQNDILKGRTDGTLAPQDPANRAEVATMLQRFVNQQV